MAISFSIVSLNHLLWKAKLASFLRGEESISESEAVSYRECELGKWLYSEGMAKYGHLPEMIRLEKIHADFHNEVKDVVKLKHRGNLEGAEAAYQKVRGLSDQVVDLIDEVEKKAK